MAERTEARLLEIFRKKQNQTKTTHQSLVVELNVVCKPTERKTKGHGSDLTSFIAWVQTSMLAIFLFQPLQALSHHLSVFLLDSQQHVFKVPLLAALNSPSLSGIFNSLTVMCWVVISFVSPLFNVCNSVTSLSLGIWKILGHYLFKYCFCPYLKPCLWAACSPKCTFCPTFIAVFCKG